MKKVILTVSIFFLLLFTVGAGCDKDEQDTLCYTGKVVSLNHGDGCYNIVEIKKNINNEGLSIGSLITFDPQLFGGQLIENDIVSFKIIKYDGWKGPGYANCLWPQFTATLELCNN